MSSKSHSKGGKWNVFCAQRKKKCSPCSQSYRDNSADPPPAGWPARWEAHHILCVACVTEFLGRNENVIKVVRNVTWCINRKHNMIPLPLWGHTIRHYCGSLGKTSPKFAELPQHNYDHNSTFGYTDEISSQLIMVADRIESKIAKAHDDPTDDLAATLDDLSTHFRNELKRRGSRNKGTDHSWRNGRTSKTWYEPFSMADDGNINPRDFPADALDEKTLKRILAAVKLFWR